MKSVKEKNVLIAIFAGIICLSGVLILALFPLHTSFSVWKGYRVLTVSPADNEQDVFTRLSKSGIVDYATESNSLLGGVAKEAPVEPFLADINRIRSSWFVNPDQNLRYFFIRDTSFLDKKVQKAFTGSKNFWYLEETGGFTLIPCILSLCLLTAGLLCSKNRFYQVFCSVPSILLTLSYNRTSGFLAALFFLLTIILTARVLDFHDVQLTQYQIRYRIRRYFYFFIPVPLAMLFAFHDGIHAGLLVSATLFSAVAAIIPAHITVRAINEAIEKQRLHPRFIPAVMNQKARSGFLPDKRIAGCILLTAVFALTGTVLFSFKAPAKEIHAGRELYIPAPSGYTRHTGFDLAGYTELVSARQGAALPDLGDFLAAQWNIRTYPWRRLQDPITTPAAGSSVDYVWYSVDRNGIISGKSKTMYVFDTGFIRKTLSSDVPQLEKMLIRQDRYVTVNLTRLQ